MAILNGYGTLEEFISRYDIDGTDAARDTTIEGTIQAVSRLIDIMTVRRFFVNASDETRYYTAEEADELSLPDGLVSLTTLATDNDQDGTYECTWSATDYKLGPPNSALDGWPYNIIRRTPWGLYVFPAGLQDGVKLVGKFGFPAVPDVIKEACYLQSYRLYLRKTAPFGVAGSAEMGQSLVIPKLDPDVEEMIAAFRRML